MKNSQTIRHSKLDNTPSDMIDDDNSINPPSGHIISKDNIIVPGGMVN